MDEPFPRRALPRFPTGKERRLVEEGAGIQTDLGGIERYLEEIIESIMENESEFIDNLLTPISRNPLEMLHLLQNSDLGSYDHFENIGLRQPVLSLDTYLDLEKQREEKRAAEKSAEEVASEDSALAEFEHIHNKVVFDAVNESINKFR